MNRQNRLAAPTTLVLGTLVLGFWCTAPAQTRGAWPEPEVRPLPEAPDEAALDDAVATALAFLAGAQEHYDPGADPEARRGRGRGTDAPKKADGEAQEWPYQGVYRVRGEDGAAVIPWGYRVGGTAIVGSTLLATPELRGVQQKSRSVALTRALEFVLTSLEKQSLLGAGFDGTYDVRGWAHVYGLQFFVDALRAGILSPEEKRRVERGVKSCIAALEGTELRGTGGWNYSRRRGGTGPASPFMTAPGVLALMDARDLGYPVDGDVLGRALDALASSRVPGSLAHAYSASPESPGRGGGTGDPAGAAARSAAVELALFQAGRGDVERLEAAVQGFFEHWKWLDQRRGKTGTHEGPYGIAPYYFYYGHWYAGWAIERLPESKREPLRRSLRQHLWLNRSAEGTWNDRIFPRSAAYGTCCALMGLLAPRHPLPAPYQPEKK